MSTGWCNFSYFFCIFHEKAAVYSNAGSFQVGAVCRTHGCVVRQDCIGALPPCFPGSHLGAELDPPNPNFYLHKGELHTLLWSNSCETLCPFPGTQANISDPCYYCQVYFYYPSSLSHARETLKSRDYSSSLPNVCHYTSLTGKKVCVW